MAQVPRPIKLDTPVNCLLIGESRSGKSSFVASCFVSLMRDFIRARAIEKGAGVSITKTLSRYVSLDCGITFFDSRGYNFGDNENKKLLEYLLDGVKAGTTLFPTEQPVEDKGNRIDQVILVIDASTLDHTSNIFDNNTVTDNTKYPPVINSVRAVTNASMFPFELFNTNQN